MIWLSDALQCTCVIGGQVCVALALGAVWQQRPQRLVRQPHAGCVDDVYGSHTKLAWE